MGNREAGDQIVGTGGLRTLRFGDSRRVKDEMDVLTPKQREAVRERAKGELKMRKQP
jgi:hypothetical protein